MERFSPLLLDVWREACRHIEIGQSVDRVAPILVRRLPLELLLVRRIDWSRGSVETVATGVCRGAPVHLRPKNECPREAMDHLRLWAETGEVICVAAEQARQRLPGLLPDGVDGEILAGPLNAEGVAVGVLILLTRPPRSFSSGVTRWLE